MESRSHSVQKHSCCDCCIVCWVDQINIFFFHCLSRRVNNETGPDDSISLMKPAPQLRTSKYQWIGKVTGKTASSYSVRTCLSRSRDRCGACSFGAALRPASVGCCPGSCLVPGKRPDHTADNNTMSAFSIRRGDSRQCCGNSQCSTESPFRDCYVLCETPPVWSDHVLWAKGVWFPRLFIYAFARRQIKDVLRLRMTHLCHFLL